MAPVRLFVAIAFVSLGVPGCERSGSPTPGKPAIYVPPVVPAVSNSGPDSLPDVVVLGDTTNVPEDTTAKLFNSDEAKGARAALEAQLASDQFNSTQGASGSYGAACSAPVANAAQSSNADVRVVFVRPRVVGIASEGATGRLLGAEITRLALIQRDMKGQWTGAVHVTRDTLWWHMRSDDEVVKWAVCGLPGHENGYNHDFSRKPFTPWLPINSVSAESGPKVTWDSNMSWAKLRHIADSVSKLPSDFVVEGNPEPALPIYYRDICPGEGCEFGEWLACDTVSVHKEAKATAPVAFTLRRNEFFTAVTGDFHILQAGKVVFNRKVRVDEEGTHMLFTPADTLYPLAYTGEGFGTWYFRGKENGGYFFFGQVTASPDGIDDPDARREAYSIVRPSMAQWWVKVRTKKGQEGWFVPTEGIRGTSPHYEPLPKACPAP
jgi:hypothetical protein